MKRIGLSLLILVLLNGLPAHSDSQPEDRGRSRVIKKLSFDLQKTGKQDEFSLQWKEGKVKGSSSCGPLGELRLMHNSGPVRDGFDLSHYKSARARNYELPERNVLVFETCGGGAAGGGVHSAFSVSGGILYRVQLIEGSKAKPLIFGEYGSSGAPFAIRFRDGGRRISTLTTTIYEPVIKHLITDYEWDGLNYRQVAQSECARETCALKE
jgi:hypothetical protein